MKKDFQTAVIVIWIWFWCIF